MMSLSFLYSSRKNPNLPFSPAFARPGEGGAENARIGLVFTSHNMGLCDTDWQGGGGGQILGGGGAAGR
jgi:hypothetical protein